MIVLDASVVVDLLLAQPGCFEPIAERLRREAPAIAAPHLLDVEVAQVMRRFVRQGALEAAHAADALEDLAALPIARYAHTPLLGRVFELRDNLTAYDATYLVLAEALGATLLTRDRRLAGAPGVVASVEVVSCDPDC